MYFISIALTLSALFLLLCGYFGTSKLIALSLLTAGVGCVGLAVAGYSVNQIDLAPRFAGVLMGITNGVGNSAGIIAPVVAKAIAHSVSVYICVTFMIDHLSLQLLNDIHA